MGMTPMLKTVPNVPFGFPGYGMTMQAILGGGFPLPETLKRCEKGVIFLTGMTPTLKTVSYLSFHWSSLTTEQQHPKGEKWGAYLME